MCFLISVWGLLSLGIRKKMLYRIQKRNTNKRQIWKPQLSQPEPWGKLGLFMQKCFLFHSEQVWKQLCGWESYTSYTICMVFSLMTVSIRAVFQSCTTARVTLTSVLPGDFNPRTFHQNSFNTGKESDQFRMEFMDIVHLSVPWSALSTVTWYQRVLT